MLVRRFPLAAPLIALVALACGGGADEVDPAAVDAAYARDACLAYLAYEDLLRGNLEAVATPGSENAGEYEAAVAESATAWLDGLRAATPPDDLSSHHADHVARLADWLAAWREGRPPPDTTDQPEPPREPGPPRRGLPRGSRVRGPASPRLAAWRFPARDRARNGADGG